MLGSVPELWIVRWAFGGGARLPPLKQEKWRDRYRNGRFTALVGRKRDTFLSDGFNFFLLNSIFFFLILFSNDSTRSVLFCISFRCTAQWLDNHILYKMFLPMFPVPTWHYTVITIAFTVFPVLYFTSP